MQENCEVTGCPVRGAIKKICGFSCCWLKRLTCPLNLAIRLVVADIFWKSGTLKLATWSSTLDLFANEYKVPLLPPAIAAYLATGVEIGGSVLLAFGLATRFAGLALLCLVGVIEFTYSHDPDHIYWALLLLVPICYGPGNLSLDYLISLKCCPNNKASCTIEK